MTASNWPCSRPAARAQAAWDGPALARSGHAQAAAPKSDATQTLRPERLPRSNLSLARLNSACSDDAAHGKSVLRVEKLLPGPLLKPNDSASLRHRFNRRAILLHTATASVQASVITLLKNTLSRQCKSPSTRTSACPAR